MENKSNLSLQYKIIFIFKMAIASGLSWQIAVWAGSKYPYLAPISVILCLQTTILKSVRFGFARIIGTILGVVVTLSLAAYLPHNGWSIAFVLLVSSGISLLFRPNITTLHQIALSALLVLVLEHKLHGYGFERIWDSLIGVIIALVIQIFFVPPNFTSTASESLHTITRQLAIKLESLSVWTENGSPMENYFESDMDNNVWNKLQKALQDLKKAEDSLRYNPFAKKSKNELNCIKLKLVVLRKEFAIIESFYDILQQRKQTQPMTKQEIDTWSGVFKQLAEALQSFSQEHTLEPSYMANEKSLYHDFLTFETIRFLNKLR